MISLKSKNEIQGIDALTGASGYARVTLNKLDLLTYSYELVYGREFQTVDEEDNPITMVQTMHVSRGRFQPAEINSLFQAANITIDPTSDFNARIRNVIEFALLYKMEADGRFGLTSSDWDVL